MERRKNKQLYELCKDASRMFSEKLIRSTAQFSLQPQKFISESTWKASKSPAASPWGLTLDHRVRNPDFKGFIMGLFLKLSLVRKLNRLSFALCFFILTHRIFVLGNWSKYFLKNLHSQLLMQKHCPKTGRWKHNLPGKKCLKEKLLQLQTNSPLPHYREI